LIRRGVDFGIVILAGGDATRLPGKLVADAGARPMLARVLANVRDASNEIVVSTSARLAGEIATIVDVPLVVDRVEARGPLAGMLTALPRMRSPFVFAVAGDAPFVDASLARRLSDAWRTGDEAVVPRHLDANGEAHDEPLAALYDRDAFVREGVTVFETGRGSMHAVLERLRTRFVRSDEDRALFTNVNTPTDYAAFRMRIAQEIA
jgi:molybdopterin-guanine dinucleotide biosynthesis protein A